MGIELSPDQKQALDSIMSWWEDGYSPLLTLGGYAGTGKTTLISQLRPILKNIRIAFCAFTGKAASVLGSKLRTAKIIDKNDYCGTIHSMIYVPVLDREGNVTGWELKTDGLPFDLIIIDEASMINEEIFYDLEAFRIPILAVGDHGQLPPVKGNLNLMEKPQVRLEHIHRHAEDNPIIKLSLLAREQGYIPYGMYGKTVAKVRSKHPTITQFIRHSKDFSETAILCGFNKTRVAINKRIRKFFKRVDDFPEIGERVLCLRNNRTAQDCPIYNGVQGTVEVSSLQATHLEMGIKIDGEDSRYNGPVSFHTFNNPSPKLVHKPIKRVTVPDKYDHFKVVDQVPDFFDYGYCLSVHKSQGSEWRRVMLVEQPCKLWSGTDWNKWLYTGVTRAIEQLLVVR